MNLIDRFDVHYSFRSPVALRRALLAIIAMTLLTLFACGSDDAATPAASDSGAAAGDTGAAAVDEELAKVSTITLIDQTFTFDDYVAAGWKKSKQFPTDTVPGSEDIWYGFFNQKDIEVRVYENHQDALDFGVEPAEAAISKNPGQTDYLIPVVNRYPAYVVFGNLVMLCERQLATCEALTSELN